MYKIHVHKDPYWEKKNMFAKSSIDIDVGLTVLVGCNGSGKTTFIGEVVNQLSLERVDNPHIKFISFNDRKQGGSNRYEELVYHQRYDELCAMVNSSEGENIQNDLGDIMTSVGNTVRESVPGDKLFILLDTIDSGLSIDNVIYIKELFELVVNDCTNKGVECYFIVSANAYEMASGETCLNVANMTYRHFRSYNDFKSFILLSAKKKAKRIKAIYGEDE